MKLEGLKTILEAEVLWGNHLVHKEVFVAYGSDLMSDVLAFVKPGALLLTGLTNAQVIRTAEMAEIAAVCFLRGKKPQEDTIKLAREKEIPLLTTAFSMFESCFRLHKAGLRDCHER